MKVLRDEKGMAFGLRQRVLRKRGFLWTGAPIVEVSEDVFLQIFSLANMHKLHFNEYFLNSKV